MAGYTVLLLVLCGAAALLAHPVDPELSVESDEVASVRPTACTGAGCAAHSRVARDLNSSDSDSDSDDDRRKRSDDSKDDDDRRKRSDDSKDDDEEGRRKRDDDDDDDHEDDHDHDDDSKSPEAEHSTAHEEEAAPTTAATKSRRRRQPQEADAAAAGQSSTDSQTLYLIKTVKYQVGILDFVNDGDNMTAEFQEPEKTAEREDVTVYYLDNNSTESPVKSTAIAA